MTTTNAADILTDIHSLILQPRASGIEGAVTATGSATATALAVATDSPTAETVPTLNTAGLGLPTSIITSVSISSSHTSISASSTSAGANVGASKVPIGEIAGGVVAALLVLVVAVFILYSRYKKRRNITSLVKDEDAASDFPPEPEPFLLRGLSERGDAGTVTLTVSTASMVIGDRSETSYADEKKGESGQTSGPPPLAPVTSPLTRRSTVMTSWTAQSGPPPSWTALSDAPPSYTTA